MKDSQPLEPSSSTSFTKTDDEHDDALARNNHHRFVGWAALLLVSCVALASKVSAATSPYDQLSWILFSVSITSIACSFISIMGFALMPQGFVGSVFEGFFAVVCQLVWIGGMPLIMDPDRNIAVSKVNTGGEEANGTDLTYIRNANIYFFSWASTICIVYVLGRFVRQQALEKQKRNRSAMDEEDQEERKSRFMFSPRTAYWYLLTLASLVVLVDSTEIYLAFACQEDNQCMPTKYALSLGAVGTFLSLGCSVLATCGMLNTFFELFFSILCFGLYMTGVVLITFGDGPGASLGNLYFATWLGAAITTVLLGQSFQGIMRHGFQSASERRPTKQPSEPLETAESTKPEEANFPDIEMGKATAAAASQKGKNPFSDDEEEAPVDTKDQGWAHSDGSAASSPEEVEIAWTSPPKKAAAAAEAKKPSVDDAKSEKVKPKKTSSKVEDKKEVVKEPVVDVKPEKAEAVVEKEEEAEPEPESAVDTEKEEEVETKPESKDE